MKKFSFILLLLGMFMGILVSCDDDDKYIPTPPSVSIENVSGIVTCLPGETIELRAKLDNPLETTFVWEQDGEKVSTDSIYRFSSTELRSFKIVLTATNVDGTDSDSLTLKVDDGLFHFSSLENWTGEGEKRSAFAVQWITGDNVGELADDKVFFLAWGYRWKEEESPKGIDMLKAIAKNDPRLFVVLAEQWGGITVKGLAYDGNNDGKISICRATDVILTQDNFIDGIYTAGSAENFDELTTADPADLWMGGWNKAYASYWLGKGEIVPEAEEFNYSPVVVSGRSLEDLSWDVWTLSSINSSMQNNSPIPRLIRAAEANK